MPDAPSAGNPFWDFSLELYARPGVAAACLALQDRHELDVNLLLFCLWAGVRGHHLDAATMARLRATVADWHGEVVRPLRGVRRWLKAGQHPSAAAALRQAVKRDELEAERLEQELLHLALPLRGDGGGDPHEAAEANLMVYLRQLAVSLNGDDRAALLALLAAALPEPSDPV